MWAKCLERVMDVLWGLEGGNGCGLSVYRE